MLITIFKKLTSSILSIQNQEEARRVIAQSAIGFIVLAMIFGGIGVFFYIEENIAIALIVGVLAAAIYILKSRVASLLLLLFTVFLALLFLLDLRSFFFQSNMLIILLMSWAAIRAVEATFKLHMFDE